MKLFAFASGGLLTLVLASCSSTPPGASAPDAGPGRLDGSESLSLLSDGGSAPTLALPPVPPSGAQQEARQAGHYPNMYRRAGLNVGAAFYGNFDTTVRVDSGHVLGATLDLEDFLGLGDSNRVLRVDGFYSFSPRHRVDFSVFDINRSGTRTIAEDIQVGPVVIPAGDVDTTLDTLIVKAAYRYNFVADTRTAIGASFGLHTMGIDLALKSQEFEVSEDFRATAPLPVLGLHGEYALSERWKLLASAELFQIDLGFARGFVGDNLIAIENDLFDHVGWGLAFNGFTLDATFEDSPESADLEYGYQGLLLYLRAYL